MVHFLKGNIDTNKGTLTDSTGAIVPNGNYNIEFKIYDVASEENDGGFHFVPPTLLGYLMRSSLFKSSSFQQVPWRKLCRVPGGRVSLGWW